jgi:hypothetical protein
LPVADCHPCIADPTIAGAICDRLVRNAHPLELKGESERKRQGNVMLGCPPERLRNRPSQQKDECRVVEPEE